MRRVLLAAALLGTAFVVPAHSSSVAGTAPGTNLPRASTTDAPELPAPAGWTRTEDFPRTSGTSALVRGSLLWSDWLYDDHGTTGRPGGNLAQVGTPSFGTYSYADGAAHGNGADVFLAGVQLGKRATTWRVDWNTLADPDVPIAAWGLDTDSDASTGGSAWPAGAGVRSPGVDRFLVVSSRAAVVLDAVTGAVLHRSTPVVDRAAQSFLATVPHTVLRPAGTWDLRLVAGVADAAGTGFAPAAGALPGQPAVYNVAFRTPEQEPPLQSFWNDTAQTNALRTGDVSAFRLPVRWADLAARRTPPPAAPRPGWNVRWYASSVDLGDGILTGGDTLGDRRPNYLGRVQPYSVYVPKAYRRGTPAPLTWLLHSLTQNHNQYGATTPKFVQQACEDRDSLCVTTLGRGPDGSYEGAAELDFWEVFREVRHGFSADLDRVVLGGYSMGGLGTTKLAAEHPDLFAGTVVLAGASGAVPGLDNLREVPAYLAHGALDELIPVSRAQEQADRLDALGHRYRFLLHPATDHVGYQLQDGFSDAAAWMGDRRRTRTPGRVTYGWDPAQEQGSRAYGVTGAYWLGDLRARNRAQRAEVDAVSGARPEGAVTAERTTGLAVPGDPSPGVVQELTWTRGAAPRATRTLRLGLVNTASLTVRLADAGLSGSAPYRLETTSDGPVRVRLHGPDGERTLVLPAGKAVRTLRP